MLYWTNTKPAKPGWYWYSGTGADQPGVYRVYEAESVLYVQFGNVSSPPVAELHGQFSGPIDEPRSLPADPVLVMFTKLYSSSGNVPMCDGIFQRALLELPSGCTPSQSHVDFLVKLHPHYPWARLVQTNYPAQEPVAFHGLQYFDEIQFAAAIVDERGMRHQVVVATVVDDPAASSHE